MGSRGASSGVSYNKKGMIKNKYGTEFHMLFQQGNIKFVVSNEGSNNAPMETMTSGRIYATVDKNTKEVKYITYYDKHNKRSKQIDLSHEHLIGDEYVKPHTHLGYEHKEKGSRKPTGKESKMITRILMTWEYFKRRR